MVVAAAAGLVLAACGNGTGRPAGPAAAPTALSGSAGPGFVPNGSAADPTSTAMPGMTGSAGSPAAPVVGATAVTIENFAFSPAAITVKVGTTVTWTNKDSEPHTVTTSKGPLHSPTMQAGATFSHTFDASGKFDYLCTIHPFMTAVVTVTP